MSEDKEKKIIHLTRKQVEEEERKEKKKNIAIIVIGAISAVIVSFIAITMIILLILLLFVFVPILLNKSNNNTSEEPTSETYQIDEYTSWRYNHIKEYVNLEWHDLGQTSNIDTIYSLNIKEDHLYLTCLSEDVPLYIDIDMNKSDEDAILNTFKDATPNVGSYSNTIVIETINTTKEKKIGYSNMKLIRGLVTDKGPNSYISFIASQDKDTYYISMTHALYREDGLYNDMITVDKSNKLLYDMYYYMVEVEK